MAFMSYICTVCRREGRFDVVRITQRFNGGNAALGVETERVLLAVDLPKGEATITERLFRRREDCLCRKVVTGHTNILSQGHVIFPTLCTGGLGLTVPL